jgi:pantothenate kinase
LLAAVINAQANTDLACVVGMDGWHYPNAYLDAHFIEREGKHVLLRALKGSPETFDAQAFLRCLMAIRQGGTVRYPVYSRRLHEPIQDGGEVGATHRVVIVEGNYLFLDEAPWDEIYRLFDVRIFLRASLEGIRTGLLERHLRGGKAADVVEKHIREVDLPNAQRVLSGSMPASIIVEKFDARLIQSIEWAEGRCMSKG